MDTIYIFDLIGTLVFGISGVRTAISKKFDVVGSIIIGIVTAVGGGTLRDLLIGETPVGWMKNDAYLYVILLAVLITYAFKEKIGKLRRSLFIFDTIGIALFTILGIEKTLNIGLSIPIALLMGIVSAVFGGVIRDVLTNEIPLLFRREIYATACLAGGIVYLGLEHFIDIRMLSLSIAIFVVMIIRYYAVKNNWGLNLNND